MSAAETEGSALRKLFRDIELGDRVDSTENGYRPVRSQAATVVKGYLDEYHEEFSYRDPDVTVNGQLERNGRPETVEGLEAELEREVRGILTRLYEDAAPYLHDGVEKVDGAVDADWRAIASGLTVADDGDGFVLAYERR